MKITIEFKDVNEFSDFKNQAALEQGEKQDVEQLVKNLSNYLHKALDRTSFR